MNEPTDKQSQYLRVIKELVIGAYNRQSRLTEVCPTMFGAGRNRPSKDALKALALAERSIHQVCEQMRAIEREAKNAFGVVSITGVDATDPVRVAICLLAAQAMTGEVRLRTTADINEYAGGRNEQALAELFRAWSRQGVLRRICRVDSRNAAHLGELGHPSIKETSLRALLGWEPNDEFDRIDSVRAMLESR